MISNIGNAYLCRYHGEARWAEGETNMLRNAMHKHGWTPEQTNFPDPFAEGQ